MKPEDYANAESTRSYVPKRFRGQSGQSNLPTPESTTSTPPGLIGPTATAEDIDEVKAEVKKLFKNEKWNSANSIAITLINVYIFSQNRKAVKNMKFAGQVWAKLKIIYNKKIPAFLNAAYNGFYGWTMTLK